LVLCQTEEVCYSSQVIGTDFDRIFLMTPAALAGTGREQGAGAQASCASCGAPLTGPFCGQCGEQVIDRHFLTLWHFLSHNLLHEFSHVDGKVFRTLRFLLFRPGFLTEEYFAGRRRAYVKPVRLLLAIVVVFALLGQSSHVTMAIGKLRLNLLPPGPPANETIADTARTLDLFGVLSRQIEKAGRTKDLKSDAAIEKFHHELKTYGTALSLSNVILLAGLLFVMFHKRRELLVEHVIFSLHLASFVLVFSLVTGWLFRLVPLLGNQRVIQITAGSLALLILMIQTGYLYSALFRFYYSDRFRKVKWWSGTAWLVRLAVLVVFLGNSVFITVVYAVGAAIALSRL
jgi:hypothetical protein